MQHHRFGHHDSAGVGPASPTLACVCERTALAPVAGIAVWSAGAPQLLSIEIPAARYAPQTDRASPFSNIEGCAHDERFV